MLRREEYVMYVMYRPSGGRGEYEVAENHLNLSPRDLVERNLVLDLAPLGSVTTNITLREQAGKLRLRRQNRTGIQLARQLEAALLLPKSIRDANRLPAGQPVLMEGRYLLDRIDLESVEIDNQFATLRPSSLFLRNQSHHGEHIDVRERAVHIRRIQDSRVELLKPLDDHFATHTELLSSNSALDVSAEKLVSDIMESVDSVCTDHEIDYVRGTDCVPAVLSMLGESLNQRPDPIDGIEPEEVEVRRRQAQRFRRWVISRGNASAKFRRAVRAAYSSRCVFCGIHLPPSKHYRRSGVDAAHILPWSEFDLDNVQNGLCLCKMHHWAYDEGLLTLRCDDKGNYAVHLTDSAVSAFDTERQTLNILKQACGPVPAARLPKEDALRPSPLWLMQRDDDLALQIASRTD